MLYRKAKHRSRKGIDFKIFPYNTALAAANKTSVPFRNTFFGVL